VGFKHVVFILMGLTSQCMHSGGACVQSLEISLVAAVCRSCGSKCRGILGSAVRQLLDLVLQLPQQRSHAPEVVHHHIIVGAVLLVSALQKEEPGHRTIDCGPMQSSQRRQSILRPAEELCGLELCELLVRSAAMPWTSISLKSKLGWSSLSTLVAGSQRAL